MPAMTSDTLAATATDVRHTPTLRDLLEDGIYLLFLLRDGCEAHEFGDFNGRIDALLAQFDRDAENFGKPRDAVEHAKYAFCALLDEIALSSQHALRADWERMPLQLRLFGEHLAGEGFFDRLDTLRRDPARNIESLEIYHLCLLLGFQGRYLLDDHGKLAALTERLARDIREERGGRLPLAPDGLPPQRIQNYLRNELPIWLYLVLLLVIATAIFGVYHTLLGQHVDAVLATELPR